MVQHRQTTKTCERVSVMMAVKRMFIEVLVQNAVVAAMIVLATVAMTPTCAADLYMAKCRHHLANKPTATSCNVTFCVHPHACASLRANMTQKTTNAY